MLSDPAEALDEVQKACCKAFVHLNQYQGQAEFRTWMLRIVENQCRMLLRSRRRARTLHLDTDTDPAVFEMASPGTGPEEEVISRELRERLQTEINRIPRLLRTVLQLRDVQELPLANVAERLNIVYVSRQLAHATPAFTLNVYSHLFDRVEHARRASTALEEGFGSALGIVIDASGARNHERQHRR